MLVLHAAVCDGSLLVWGESSEVPDAPHARRKKPVSAWFDAGAAAVAGAAREASLYPGASTREARQAVAWLPSSGGRALPSSAVMGGEGASDEGASLQPWRVAVLPVAGETLVHALARCRGRRMLAPGVMAGPDLLYWADALRAVAGLAQRGQFLPGLRRDGETWQARWTPVATGVDADHLRLLAEAMPPAARALTWDLEPSPPATPPAMLLADFLECALDTVARVPRPLPALGPESVHDLWMEALSSSDAVLRGKPDEIEALAAQVEQWQRPIRAAARAPFRLCFRLEEPEGGDESWRIAYLLQSARDPSLLVAAAAVWQADARALSTLGEDLVGMREHLLGSLGQAAGICPRVERSLKEARPDGYNLDAGGALEFLRQTAPALEQSGFGVMLPAWWTRGGAQARLSVRAHVKSPLAGGGGLSLESIVQFDWQAALGGELISRAELGALARLKTPLVKVRGKWVEVDGRQIRAALELLGKKASAQARLADVVKMAVGAGNPESSIPVDGVTASGWVGELLAKLENDARMERLPPPAGLQATLRPYQEHGYSWLRFLTGWGLGACLADDMGLGKTVQALALMQREYVNNGGKPALLVCPTSVVGNWRKEAARFTPELPVLIHHGSSRRRGDAFAREAARHAIVISSYSLLARDLEQLRSVSWSGLILDEAQNIKNPETRQAKAARAIASGYRVALTGTPVENNAGDLWSIMEFLNPGFLGTAPEFRRRFLVPIQIFGDAAASALLRRVTAPFVLRRVKTDKSVVADLPDKLEMKVFCTLTREQASLYEAVVGDATRTIGKAEGIQRKGLVLATLAKLKQVCNHPAQFLKDHSALPGRSGKLSRLCEMLEETIEAGDRSLIFTQFSEMGELLRRHLRDQFGIEVLYLYGGTPRKEREAMVERFAARDGPPVFLLSLKAGGTGLNLTSANHVFHFDRWWNPAVEDQATDRAFRIGQTRNVQVHKFLCAGTVEEKIDEMIERKKDVAVRLVGAGENWLTELSNAELRDLFALRREAIGD